MLADFIPCLLIRLKVDSLVESSCGAISWSKLGVEDLKCSQIWESVGGCWEILSFPVSVDRVVTTSVFTVLLQSSLAFVPWSALLFQQTWEPFGFQGPGRSEWLHHPGTPAACTGYLRLSCAYNLFQLLGEPEGPFLAEEVAGEWL